MISFVPSNPHNSTVIEIFFILLLLCFFIIGPLGAIARLAAFFSRPADYIYNENRGMSSIHDVCVMLVIPISGLMTGVVDPDFGHNNFNNDYIGEAILVALILLVVVTYFACTARRRLFAPLLELGANLTLGAGIMINLYLIWGGSTIGPWVSLLGHGPVVILLGLMLVRRYRLFLQRMPEMMDHVVPYAEVLDYLPESDYVEPYYVERRGATAMLLLELPLRLLLYSGIGGGLAALLVMVGITLEGIL